MSAQIAAAGIPAIVVVVVVAGAGAVAVVVVVAIAIAGAGLKLVICNHPDEECAEQPGLQIRYLPAESGKGRDARGAGRGVWCKRCPKPVLACGRTGMRSTTMGPG